MAAPASKPRMLKLWMVWGVLSPLLGILLLGFQVHTARDQVKSLRAELTGLRLAHRASASRESLAAEAHARAARLEETLAVMRRETTAAVPPPAIPASPETDPAAKADHAAETTHAAELERVISFLRQEITAAHETIDRLKQDQR